MRLSVLLLTILCFAKSRAFASWVPGLIVAGGATLVAKPLYCYLNECCKDRWIPNNITGLKAKLEEKVFGQHLAIEVVHKAIKGHTQNKNPAKALVLSFHGWTGSGKNHVSRIIADNLYKEGMGSKYVHQIIATHDFPHKHRVPEYQEKLRNFIVEKVSNCERSLFIFDEVDKVPPGLMDTLRPFLEHHRDVGGIDYRKTIFIFLSNTGGNIINDFVFKHWRQGNKREDLTIKQMDPIVNKGAFNLEGGLWHSELIFHNLIDYCVPFLPLEKTHVKQCIKEDLRLKNKPINPEIVNRVANLLQYDEDKRFSKSGCKKVSSKVDFVVG